MTAQQLRSCLKQGINETLEETRDASPVSDKKVENNLNSKMVTFDEIDIYEFKIILGDNPAVSSGPPIAIGSKLSNTVSYDVDFYEYFNPSSERPKKRNLMIPVPERAALLMNAGYDINEIANATLKVQEIQEQRMESYRHSNSKGFGMLGEAMRRSGRMLLGKVSFSTTQPSASNYDCTPKHVSAKSA